MKRAAYLQALNRTLNFLYCASKQGRAHNDASEKEQEAQRLNSQSTQKQAEAPVGRLMPSCAPYSVGKQGQSGPQERENGEQDRALW